MGAQSAYLLLEAGVVAFVLAFTFEHRKLRALLSRPFLVPAALLLPLWFAIDLLALKLGLWWFPPVGSLPVRIFELPLEECLLFFLHTLICFLLVEQYTRS